MPNFNHLTTHQQPSDMPSKDFLANSFTAYKVPVAIRVDPTFYASKKSPYLLYVEDGTHPICLSKHIGTKKVIPEYWPTPQVQIGHCCGFYALSVVLTYEKIQAPPARKRDFKEQQMTSLHQIGKQLKQTSIGEILNIEAFGLILQTLGILSGYAKRSTKSQFIDEIIKAIETKHTVIVSCDIREDSIFPGRNNGEKIHWVVVFGYVEIDEVLYFLVANDSHYALWSAEALLQSNDQLGEDILPRCEKFGYFRKTTDVETEYEFVSAPHSVNGSHCTKMTIPNTKKSAFFYSLFAFPTQHQSQKITREDQLAKAIECDDPADHLNPQ